MKKPIVSIIFVISILLGTSFTTNAENNLSKSENCMNSSIIRLKYGMQKLWIEHAWWTRSLIVSTEAELEDQQIVLERLLQNQVELGNIFKSYYGTAAANSLTNLLKEHILIGEKVIEAAKKNNQPNLKKFNNIWYRNADQIVLFLTNINPNWSKKELTDMFYAHLEITTNEAIDRLKKDWKGDIRLADRNESHLIQMGDFLTDGIVKQFPNKFK